jgi:predicted esterase
MLLLLLSIYAGAATVLMLTSSTAACSTCLTAAQSSLDLGPAAAADVHWCRGSYGPDVDFINRSMSYVFDRYAVDPARLGIAGFSDGASYALSLGLPNGDLFSHIIAFSPGFMRPFTVVRCVGH